MFAIKSRKGRLRRGKAREKAIDFQNRSKAKNVGKKQNKAK